MRWGTRILFIAACVAAVLPKPASAAPPSMSLGLGQSAFWPGAFVADGSKTAAFEWPMHVAGGAARLRVAVDTPMRTNTFALDLIDPSGATSASAATNNSFDAEAFVEKPVAGVWTVKVTPQSVSNSTFRMRAKLESALPGSPAGKVALLPNLKAVPPFEFGFVAPANPLNGLYPPDTVNPPLDVAGVHPLSCAPDEMAPVELGGSGAHTCLRLTSGPINVGSGPFDMRFDLAGDLLALKAGPQPTNITNTVKGPMLQAVHYSDSSVQLRPAGTYSFHTTHGHFHTDQILTYELFKVTDATKGALHQESAGTKSGFCPADQLFGDWRSFTQRAPGDFGEGDTATGNCMSPYKGALGLTVGWGDVYRWQRPGQFVEFDGGDGLYVVRTTVDKNNLVLEENEADNASYAYIKVTGHDVQLLERGQGTDPWDVHKTVFRGAGPASVDDIGGPLEIAGAAASAGTQVAAQEFERPVLPVTGGGTETAWPAAAVVGITLGVRARRRRILTG
jgi:hypothetical protein